MDSKARTGEMTRLFIHIDEAIESGSITRALRLVLSNFDNFPDNSPLRERVAQALATRGRKREAVQILELVARHYANSGHPARSLSAIKQMNTLQPDATMLLDHFAALSSIRSPYRQEELARVNFPEPDKALDMGAKEPQVGEQELFDLAIERSMEKRGIVTQPRELPSFPLLSLLPTETLRRVLDFVQYEVHDQSQPLLTRGEQPKDLIWSVSQNLLLKHDDDYMRLPSNVLLGLNGFGRPKADSEHTVHAIKTSEILRLSEDAIQKLSEEFTDFPNRLATLRRHGLTERLIASHPLFAQLDEAQRDDLIERFIGLHIKQGEYLIVQDMPSPGLFIILDGQVDIVRKDEDWEITINTLNPGDMFGEIGLVSEKPAVAGVVSVTQGIMLFLSRDEFNQAAAQHPALAKYAVRLANQRLEDVNSTLSAGDLAEVD